MSLYRITHIDAARRLRRMRVLAASRAQAVAEVETAFGTGWCMTVVCMGVAHG